MGAPGYQFIEQYDKGLPQSREELASCVRAYGDYLRRESGQTGELPVDIKAICNHFSLNVRSGKFKNSALDIDGVNLAELGIILYEESDARTRQRYTQAHELMECLIIALRGNQYPLSVESYLIESAKKEKLCNWGASLLLMPPKPFKHQVSTLGLGIKAAEQIGSVFKTSRLATLWHQVNSYPRQCGLIIWKRAHKPTEKNGMPDPNQLGLWEGHAPAEPVKKMRVQWSVFGRDARRVFFAPRHKSVEETSLIVEAEKRGGLVAGSECVDLNGIQGEFDVEAVPFLRDGQPHILSLFHWPKEVFYGIDTQESIPL